MTIKRLSVYLGFLVIAVTACHKNNDITQPPAAPITSSGGSTPTGGGTTVSTATITTGGTTTTGGTSGGATGTTTTGTTTTGTTPPSGSLALQIYTDDLHQGGAFLYPGGDNQTLAFNDTSNPAAGTSSTRYMWNGGDVAGQHVFAGMDLIHSGGLNDYPTTPGKDLRAGKYTHVTFDARGSLGPNTIVKIEVADDGNPSTPAPCVVLSASGMEDDSTPGNPISSCLNKSTLQGSWQSYSIPVAASDLSAVKDYFKATFIYKGAAGTSGNGGTLFLDQILYQS
jgi:hypothetical protein